MQPSGISSQLQNISWKHFSMTNTPFSWLIVLGILPDLCELYVEMYISKGFKWLTYNISILKFWREFPLRQKRVNKKEKKHFSCHKDILLKQYQFIVFSAWTTLFHPLCTLVWIEYKLFSVWTTLFHPFCTCVCHKV